MVLKIHLKRKNKPLCGFFCYHMYMNGYIDQKFIICYNIKNKPYKDGDFYEKEY